MTKYDSWPVPGTYSKLVTSGVEILASMSGFDQRELLFVRIDTDIPTVWPIGACIKVGQNSPRRYTAMSVADLDDPLEIAKFAGVLRYETEVAEFNPTGLVLIHGTVKANTLNCNTAVAGVVTSTPLTTEQVLLLPHKRYLDHNDYLYL